jgi:hypothetical protein
MVKARQSPGRAAVGATVELGADRAGRYAVQWSAPSAWKISPPGRYETSIPPPSRPRCTRDGGAQALGPPWHGIAAAVFNGIVAFSVLPGRPRGDRRALGCRHRVDDVGRRSMPIRR